MNKDVRQLVRELAGDGWSVTITGGGHLRAVGPGGLGPVFLPSTPSDHRTLRNVIAKLKRAGWSRVTR